MNTQDILITVTRRRRVRLKVSILVLLLLPLAWFIGRTEWDRYTSYSGVVIAKGMDCNLCLLSDEHSMDLYIILRDESGKRSKRYVGSDFAYTTVKRWNEIAVGGSVVKDKGFGELPYEPGRKSSRPLCSKGEGWLFTVLILVCGTALIISFRQLWKALCEI